MANGILLFEMAHVYQRCRLVECSHEIILRYLSVRLSTSEQTKSSSLHRDTYSVACVYIYTYNIYVRNESSVIIPLVVCPTSDTVIHHTRLIILFTRAFPKWHPKSWHSWRPTDPRRYCLHFLWACRQFSKRGTSPHTVAWRTTRIETLEWNWKFISGWVRTTICYFYALRFLIASTPEDISYPTNDYIYCPLN